MNYDSATKMVKIQYSESYMKRLAKEGTFIS